MTRQATKSMIVTPEDRECQQAPGVGHGTKGRRAAQAQRWATHAAIVRGALEWP